MWLYATWPHGSYPLIKLSAWYEELVLIKDIKWYNIFPILYLSRDDLFIILKNSTCTYLYSCKCVTVSHFESVAYFCFFAIFLLIMWFTLKWPFTFELWPITFGGLHICAFRISPIKGVTFLQSLKCLFLSYRTCSTIFLQILLYNYLLLD